MNRRALLLGLSALAAGRADAATPGWPLWVLRRGAGTVYLTGECPGGHEDWRDAHIEGLVAGCAAVWTEAGTASRGPVGPLIARYGLDPTAPLPSKLTEDDKARLAEVAAVAKIPVERLSTNRPWLAAYQLDSAVHRARGLTGKSANEVLAAEAKAAGVPVESEFPAQDDTLARYGSLSPTADLQFLRFTLDSLLTPDNEAREDADWARGDLHRTETALKRANRLYPELSAALFATRNRDWVPRIETMLQAPKPSVVVVGSYHLPGPDGLLAQLEAAGLPPRRA